MVGFSVEPFIGWHRQERGTYYAFTRVSSEQPDAYGFECWKLARYGMPGPEDDEWWDPGWYLFGPATWGEFMDRTLPEAKDAAWAYIAARRCLEAPATSAPLGGAQ